MSTRKIECPLCGVNVEYPEEMEGNQSYCPKCNAQIELSGGYKWGGAAPTAPVPTPPPKPSELDALRARSKYPTLRSMADAVSKMLYVLGSVSFLVVIFAFVKMFDNDNARFFDHLAVMIGFLLGGAFFILLGQIASEALNLFIDGVDALLEMNGRKSKP